jgi:hypothetical protein
MWQPSCRNPLTALSEASALFGTQAKQAPTSYVPDIPRYGGCVESCLQAASYWETAADEFACASDAVPSFPA